MVHFEDDAVVKLYMPTGYWNNQFFSSDGIRKIPLRENLFLMKI